MMKLLFLLLIFPIFSFALPIKITKSVVIREAQSGKALTKGPYVLKAGSVIEIPDQYVVRNSIGDIDLIATLLNWRTSDRRNGVLSIVDANNKSRGQDVFFELKVIEAAAGSVLPKDFTGVIALDYLARTRSLAIVQDTAPVNPSVVDTSGSPASSSSNLPETAPIPEPRPRTESQLPALGSSGGAPIPTPPPLESPSKQEVLQPDTVTSEGDLRVFEKPSAKAPEVTLPPTSKAPVPTPRPSTAGAAQAIEVATRVLPGAGTADSVCPNGDCTVGAAGTDTEDRLVCEQIAKGDFPASLSSLPKNASGVKTVDASIRWISRVLKNPAQCRGSCTYDSSGFLGRLLSPQGRLNSYCESIKNCADRCKTSEIQTTWKCTTDSKKRAKECARTCSPYKGISTSVRMSNLKGLLDQVSSDIERNKPDYAKRMKANSIFDNMDQRLLCLNLRRENVDLDPMARNCSSTAIGIGQVLVGTFYYSFGLANKTQQKNCINYKLKDLASKCRGWDRHAFRSEVYSKYMDYTPKELYEMRTLDVELQARSTYAVFLDKLRISGFNLNKAYRSYFGKSDQNAINRIENCVRTGR